MYSLPEIQKAHHCGTSNPDLERVANWCWSYVNKITDFRTLKGSETAWIAAYYHVESNSVYLQSNTLPK